ncbi:Leukotriene A-4 hydrolase [Temnothorax longispinosus]|uniref:Leukotriene A-4 hydrolase n=1 Tax=Temnothorax longispinosus TaxID=300112 RepID=A0A4S2L337_9HYME|nr:Leukotriene A-4 hydrolase [Temnothorax longispinosus]
MIQKLKNSDLLKCLLPNFTGLLPHETIENVPYELGYTLLFHLEKVLGASFEQFLKSYFNKFALKSINKIK